MGAPVSGLPALNVLVLGIELQGTGYPRCTLFPNLEVSIVLSSPGLNFGTGPTVRRYDINSESLLGVPTHMIDSQP